MAFPDKRSANVHESSRSDVQIELCIFGRPAYELFTLHHFAPTPPEELVNWRSLAQRLPAGGATMLLGLRCFVCMKRMVFRVATALLLTGCCTMQPSPSREVESRAWDYRVVEAYHNPLDKESSLQRQLNDAGGEGFVIVSTTTLPGDANRQAKTIVILKRPKK
jgi:hypothetical protein